jgi:hypothetical protein
VADSPRDLMKALRDSLTGRRPTVAERTSEQAEVRGLMTLQWSWGGLFDGRPAFDICLVRSTARGTPGPTLCGRDRFAPDAPGWSVGGGIYGPDVKNTPCAECVAVRDRDYPHLRVGGSCFGHMFAPAKKASEVQS